MFVVDPIDGTIAFLKGKPHFTICAAVVRDGRPSAGAVYNPISDDMFSAARDMAPSAMASRSGSASQREVAEGCRMLGDRTKFAQDWPQMAIENRNSVAYRLALVAAEAVRRHACADGQA